jgi:hypothetical protein
MSEPSLFRHYLILQDAEGSNVELVRSAEQVAVLAFDNECLEFVHCHVLLEPPANRVAFEEACRTLQQHGHPLLAPLVDFGEDDGNPFYITGNVDGETLRGYLQRQSELPLWLAAMLATRALDAAIALSERGDYLYDQPLDSFRLVQVSTNALQVQVADYRVVEKAARSKTKTLKANFERQAKFLRTFLHEQGGGGGPTLPDTPLAVVDFTEILGSTLSTGGPGLTTAMKELRNALQKMVPDHLAGEIPTAQKPRALVAPLLASYQEVARGVVNLVRIQSQRLDMANPYAMRGTMTRTGRSVSVEQVPPNRLCGKRVAEIHKQVQKLAKKRDYNALVPVPLLHAAESLTCMAEELVEGVPLSDILRERSALEIAEVYLVLAGLDAALAQLDRAALETGKLRLEDIFLLTGFGRDDPRSNRLLGTKLNEWPSFTVMLRAHPTLASMSGRGINPSAVLPRLKAVKGTPWHGGWLAAVGRFLVGLDSAPAEASRDRESVIRLFDDEIAKARDGAPATRSDLLGRFARVIQHYDLVAPSPITTTPAAEPRIKPSQLIHKDKPPPPMPADAVAKPAPSAPPNLPPSLPDLPIGAGTLIPAASEADSGESIGFAELLFQSPAEADIARRGGHWGQGASNDFASGQVGNWGLEEDPSPWWLKAAVFIGGSMVIGAILAHQSGHAVWQKAADPAPPAVISGKP